jgi:hypothetical protein
MRSSKSRSRSKSNRPRTLGNITNRVFESSGPEGKVRGTPQQIIDKYNQLARDAQLSNDRVNAENFLQHAEHYTRLLGEAMREMQAEQDQRRQNEGPNQGSNQGGNQSNTPPREYQSRDRGDGQQPDPRDDRSDNARNDNGRDDNGRDDRSYTPREDRSNAPREDRNNAPREDRSNAPREDRNNAPREDRNNAPREERNNERRNRHVQRSEEVKPQAIPEARSDDGDSGLVETPEQRRPRPFRQPKAQPAPDAGNAPQVLSQPQPAASTEAAQVDKPRKTRVARKPKPDAGHEAAE